MDNEDSQNIQNSTGSGKIWVGLAFAAVLLIGLRIYCAAAYRIDSDEPQHLHVVWGIAHGLVQYRDLFDNHSPLFQWLCVPLFQALGERSDIVEPMRFAMIPLYFGCLACIYGICSRLFSRRCGVLATAVTAFHPRFFCTSLEFRPDNLWALVWLLLLIVLLCVRRPALRWLLAGLLAGTGFAVSMKTTVMMLDLGGAGIFVWLQFQKYVPSGRNFFKSAMYLLCGLVVVPAILLRHFAAADALRNLGYCLVDHNLIAASERVHGLQLREFATLGIFVAILFWSRRVFQSTPDRSLAFRRVFLLTAGGLYPVILFVIWPLVTREDFLALIPLAGMVLAVFMETVISEHPERFAHREPIISILAVLLILTELVGDIRTVKPWHDRTALKEQFINNVLRLTDSSDYVMDAKGETIFRNRPYYYVLEEMTRWKLKENVLPDDIPEHIVAHKVCVAVDNRQRYPSRTAQFLKTNFIPVADHLLVAGKFLDVSANKPFEFDLPIPATYRLECPGAPGAVFLDSNQVSIDQPVELCSGRHTLVLEKGAGPVAVVWTNAIERGFSPFFRASKEEKRENRQAARDNIL